jgi:hypothetical protein
MTFLLDTGSAWTWLPGHLCPRNECAGERFDDHKSSTYARTGKEVSIRYGKGRLRGFTAHDQVRLSQDSAPAKQIDFLTVVEADNLDRLVSDGLLGLGPKASNQ